MVGDQNWTAYSKLLHIGPVYSNWHIPIGILVDQHIPIGHHIPKEKNVGLPISMESIHRASNKREHHTREHESADG
jgi:hypothetical protein